MDVLASPSWTIIVEVGALQRSLFASLACSTFKEAVKAEEYPYDDH